MLHIHHTQTEHSKWSVKRKKFIKNETYTITYYTKLYAQVRLCCDILMIDFGALIKRETHHLVALAYLKYFLEGEGVGNV